MNGWLMWGLVLPVLLVVAGLMFATPARGQRPHLFPGHLELIDRRHVGHRASGGQVGQDDLLMRGAERRRLGERALLRPRR